MRTDKQYFKCIALTTLLSTGLIAGSIAQDASTIVSPEKQTPVIITTTPSGGEANVDLNSIIEITFSSEMDETTINGNNIMLHATSAIATHQEHGEMLEDQMRDRSAYQDSDKSWQGIVNGTISYSNKVAVFTPDEELKEGALYTLTVTNGVKNLENVALDKEQSFSFTTLGAPGATYSEKQGTENGMDNNKYSESSADARQKEEINMIELGKAGQFVILAKTTIKNGSDSRITGHTGEGSVADKVKKEKEYTEEARKRVSGQVIVLQSNQSDTTSPDVNEAIEDMMSAYSDATFQNGGDLNSHKDEHFQSNVLTPGVHEWSESLHLESDITLSGSADDVWLFKVSEDLIIDENVVLTLTDGAQAENVFWYVEGEVSIGENAQFEGIILSMNEITLEKGAKLNGRMFSQTSISLDDNTVTEPGNMDGRTTSTNR